MGMSTHIAGYKAPDDRWRAMKAAWDACLAANVPTPEEVIDYFDGEAPDPAGVEIDETTLGAAGAVREWEDAYRKGFEIVVANLPADVQTIRFWNSW